MHLQVLQLIIMSALRVLVKKMALLGKMPLPLLICVVKSMSIKMEMFFIFREERIMFQLKCLLFLMGILLLELLLGHLQFSQEM